VLGPLRLERAYYHCAQCQGGFCPRDRALRLEPFALTPGVLRMTVSTAALASFEESSTLLHELAGVEVSISQVQRAAEALGAEVGAVALVAQQQPQVARDARDFGMVRAVLLLALRNRLPVQRNQRRGVGLPGRRQRKHHKIA